MDANETLTKSGRGGVGYQVLGVVFLVSVLLASISGLRIGFWFCEPLMDANEEWGRGARGLGTSGKLVPSFAPRK